MHHIKRDNLFLLRSAVETVQVAAITTLPTSTLALYNPYEFKQVQNGHYLRKTAPGGGGQTTSSASRGRAFTVQWSVSVGRSRGNRWTAVGGIRKLNPKGSVCMVGYHFVFRSSSCQRANRSHFPERFKRTFPSTYQGR